MISINPDILAVIISFVTLLALIGGGFFWLGKLSNRVDQLDMKVDRLADDMRDLREGLDHQRTELLEEMRRGNQQLLIALANHGHDDGGQPVFRVPVGAE